MSRANIKKMRRTRCLWVEYLVRAQNPMEDRRNHFVPTNSALDAPSLGGDVICQIVLDGADGG